MNVYTTDRIRNVVLLGHGGCGKTSLVEAMAYLAGLTTRMGTVADKNTISDFEKRRRNASFRSILLWSRSRGKTAKLMFWIPQAILILSGKSKRQFPQRMQQLSLFPEKRESRQARGAPGKSVKKIIFHV